MAEQPDSWERLTELLEAWCRDANDGLPTEPQIDVDTALSIVASTRREPDDPDVVR